MFCLLGLVIQVLGRCEPICFILCLLLVKNWKYEIIREEKWVMVGLDIAGIGLDVFWLGFAGGRVSTINYYNLFGVDVLTYILVAVKVLFLLYLLMVEKPCESEEESGQKSGQ